MKHLGRENARTLVDVLELPDDERWSFISRIYARDDGQALADTGRSRTGPFRADAREDESRSAYRARRADSV